MLHPDLKQKLLERDNLLAEKINGPDKESIPARDFLKLTTEITDFVRNAIDGRPELRDALWNPKNEPDKVIKIPASGSLISDTTLWRYFGYDRNHPPPAPQPMQPISVF